MEDGYMTTPIHKTTAMKLLEAERHKDIRDVMLDSLEKYRAGRNLVKDCCADLSISYGTFYIWASMFGINVGSYHFAETRRG